MLQCYQLLTVESSYIFRSWWLIWPEGPKREPRRADPLFPARGTGALALRFHVILISQNPNLKSDNVSHLTKRHAQFGAKNKSLYHNGNQGLKIGLKRPRFLGF